MLSKRVQQILFLITFINCCVVITLISLSISTDYWVLARPYRQLPSTKLDLKLDSKNLTQENIDYLISLAENGLIEDNSNEEDDELPMDLYAKKDCQRYNGKIKFGLFKGVWLLNYAYGCKNRLNKVSIIDMLRKHKLFDLTLWISTILCCSLAIFSTLISSIFSILNAFWPPKRTMHGPISMYLWNSISVLFHLLAIVFFSFEFHLYIKKNVLTKDELESGWISTNRAQLGWSFYILIVSILLIVVNIFIIYLTERLNQQKNLHKTNSNIINGDNVLNKNNIKQDYQKIKEIPKILINDSNNQINEENLISLNNDGPSSSKKLKRIIDFIY